MVSGIKMAGRSDVPQGPYAGRGQPRSAYAERQGSMLAAAALVTAGIGAGSLSTAAASDDAFGAADAAGADAAALDTIVVTGTRGLGRTAADSPVPIDVISGAELQQVGGANSTLKDALEKLAPSFVVNARSNSSVSTIATPAGLRGLSGAHVLVLVNGKRRHNSALTSSAADSQAISANPVDLDFIPLAAVDHIEILRDGAAAQYGSDAIAGVINVILKSADSGGTIAATAGQRYKWEGIQDGGNVDASADAGFKLGSGGFFHVAVEGQKQNWSLRNGVSTQQFYFPLADGSPDPRELTIDKRAARGGTPRIDALKLAFNAALPFDGDTSAYASGTVGHRNGREGQSFRLANSVNVIPELLNGQVLQPITATHELDYQIAAGVKGSLAGWSWDFSSTYGRDHVDVHEDNSQNPSLGLAGPLNFATYTAAFSQWTTNLDLTRPLDVGLLHPVQLSWGLEHRYERYQVHPVDEAAYANGGYVFPSGPLAGKPASIGAQAAVLILPEDAANLSRNNEAAYVDLGTNLTDKWYVAAAGRFEHYSDSAGNTSSGKFTTRYDFTPTFAVRGTVSNGFRAPSLSQTGFASGSQGPFVINGVIAGITTSRIAKPGSPLADALGASPLKPEKSINISFGETWRPLPNFSLDVDAYQIRLNDRIVRTTTFSGPGVQQILVQNGFDPNQTVSYNTNGIDTTTRGADVVSSYLQDLKDHGLGELHWSLGFNWNTTQIESIKATPPQLAALGLTPFDRIAQSYLTVALPKTKLLLGADWQIDKVAVNLHTIRYGEVRYLASNTADFLRYGAKWITDIDVEYAVTHSLAVAAGANNIFNVYPDKSGIPDAIGTQLYAPNSPFGNFGGFYYVRATWSFD